MIPITAGILQTQAHRSLLHNFLSAVMYITGIALIYATLGYVSATTSAIFGYWLASPWFIIPIIIFFLYLAFSLFGFYELHMPRFLSYQGTINAHGSLVQSFIFGLISGTVASPCLTPALALLLGIAAKQANPFWGFLTLFSFSIGMGLLLLLIGTFSSTLAMLPRAGEWMNHIKTIFGFLMIGICINFLQPFFEPSSLMLGYAGIAGAATIFYGRKAKTDKLAFALSIIAFVCTIVFALLTLKMFIV